MKHLHILGLSGTFMSGLALLAREAGFKVTGSDANCYPPVSDLLKAKGIEWVEGYEDSRLALQADTVLIGNAIKRGMPVLEAVLDKSIAYTSGPQWLAENILKHYKVMAVSGTHGKTTTTSMLSWILEQAGLAPGFLIGGISSDFNTNARHGSGSWFVIEADEYDSAFFDKRPKFMHYRPHLALLNNLDFDHADIYTDLAAIQQQFTYFLRTVPSSGIILKPKHDNALNEVVARDCYSRMEEWSLSSLNADWSAELMDEAGQAFSIFYRSKKMAEIHWSLIGSFNVENALAAVAASTHAGVDVKTAARALEAFTPVKRRLEVKSSNHGITIYDDFAHHPTAIRKTLEGLKASRRHQRILVIMEFASYTMRSGVHASSMGDALALADQAFLLQPGEFSLDEQLKNHSFPWKILPTTVEIVEAIKQECRRPTGWHVCVVDRR